MYNSQYYTCEQIDQRLLQGYLDDYNSQNNTNLTKEQFLTLLFNTIGRNGTVDNLVTQIGYYECDTAAGTAAKAITVANYNLFAGGSMKVKFVNKNTANNATLNINSQGAKALYYQGERASSTNSWDEGEVVEIYYDGTNYYANNVKGGSGSGVYDVSVEHPTSGPNEDGKFTLEYILNPSNVNELIPVNKRYPGMSIQFVSTYNNKYVQYKLMTQTFSTILTNWQGVDDEPIAGSENMVKSGGVIGSIGNIPIFDDVVTYTSPSTWEADRRFYNHAISLKNDALLYYKNENSAKAVCRVTYSDNSTKEFDLNANTENIISIANNGLAIKWLFCYYQANASSSVGNNIKITIIQTMAKDIYELNNTINSLRAAGYLYIGIATTSTNPGTPTEKVFYVAINAGTYTNFGNLEVTQGINILKFNRTAWSVEQIIGIDNQPVISSNSLINSKAVFDAIGHVVIYDGTFTYQETGWETQRRFFNVLGNYGDNVILNVVNNTGASAEIRVTYSDSSTETVVLPVGTYTKEFGVNGKTISILYTYFLADKRPDGELHIDANYNTYFDIGTLKKSEAEYNNVKGGINGSVFVKSSNLDINRFFKELYITPVWPDEFELSATTKIIVYRNKDYTSYHRWTIIFGDNTGAQLTVFDVQENPESNEVITLAGTSSSHKRFNGYAVVDWSQVKENTMDYYNIDATLTELCLDIKYSPYLHYYLDIKNLLENGYKYKGIAKEFRSWPSTPVGKEFYISSCPGTFPNFGNLFIPANNVGLFKYDGSAWSVDLINFGAMTSQGLLTLFDGNISYSGSTNWERDRRFYQGFCSWGRVIRFEINNETGVTLSYRISYIDGTERSSSINPATKEITFDNGKEINEVFFFFAANVQPEGNVKIVAYANNYYYIDKLTKQLEKIDYSESVSGSVISGGNILLRIAGDFKKDEEYYIQIDGTLSVEFLLRGYTNGVVTELGGAYCGCTYKIVPSKDFDYIGIAKNSVSENGTATFKLISKTEWGLLQNENAIKLGSVGLTNRKNTYISGSGVRAEVVGDFKAGESYEVSISGNNGSGNTFLIFLFSLTNTELYRTTESYHINRTYIFKCPVNAEKLSILRNGIVGDVTIYVNVRRASVVRETRTLPNFVGIPIASHQGTFRGGSTIGSPRSWAKAARLGYKWIECDIQFTSDDVPVFLHDYPININGNYIVSKADGTPVNKDDNITVESLTWQELKETYRWADGGEIISLVEGFGFLNMLGCNAVLEFKAYADNDTRRTNLKNACLQFGIERIIYNATSTDYRVIFPTLINMGIYLRGAVSLTSSDENAVEAAFAYAAQIGGASVNAYGISGGIDTAFIQRMMETYGVKYHGGWGETNERYQVGSIVSNDIAPVKGSYANSSALLNNADVDYADYTSVGTFTITELSNVNLSMIADTDVIVRIQSINKDYYGNVNVAYILEAGTYNVYVKGTGHIAEIMVRY